MTRQKQIEEIKETIDSLYGADCAYFDVDGFGIASVLHDAGYRKEADVADEIIDKVEAELNKMFEMYAVLGQAECCMLIEIIWRKLSAKLKKNKNEGKE